MRVKVARPYKTLMHKHCRIRNMSGKRKHHAFPKLKTTPLNSWNQEKTKQWIETEGVLEQRVMRLTVR